MMSLFHFFLPLALAPLLQGSINRTKALFAGRKGPPLLQTYYDLYKLLQKGAVYSRTTTWIFRMGPLMGLAALLVAATLVPMGGVPAPMAFAGDLILFVYLLGLGRFFLILAALDTGSSFEGMGGSREAQFSMLAEPALFLGFAAVGWQTGGFSISGILTSLSESSWNGKYMVLALVAVALFIVLLVENARIPFDDPNTHLELTMIHEVMVLDHGGPDLAFILYSAALKLWLMASLVVGIVLPLRTGNEGWDTLFSLGGIFLAAAIVGVVESTMARLRLLRIPQLLVGAGALAAIAVILLMRS